MLFSNSEEKHYRFSLVSEARCTCCHQTPLVRAQSMFYMYIMTMIQSRIKNSEWEFCIMLSCAKKYCNLFTDTYTQVYSATFFVGMKCDTYAAGLFISMDSQDKNNKLCLFFLQKSFKNRN